VTIAVPQMKIAPFSNVIALELFVWQAVNKKTIEKNLKLLYSINRLLKLLDVKINYLFQISAC